MPTAANFDSTGMRLVAKGLSVTMGERLGVVVKLRNGHALILWGSETVPAPEFCKDLTVTKGVARQQAQLLLF